VGAEEFQSALADRWNSFPTLFVQSEALMTALKHQVPIDTTPAKVFAALATQAGLRHWWTADVKADEKAGGKAEFGFDERQMVFRMKIEKLEPGKQVVWSCHGDHPEWNGTTLTWNIAHKDGATVLRFTHGGWKSASEYCAMCNSTWGDLMYRLKGYLEGKNPGPQWRE
jgi:uncharacterized protein YndB with AHSA1/START domain